MAANLDIVIGAIDKASGTLDKVEGRMGRIGSVGGKVLKAGMLAGAAGIAAAGVAAFKFGNDFKKAENIIRAGTGATGEALEGMYGDFKKVFAAIPTDMDKAASAVADWNTLMGLTGEIGQEASKRSLEAARVLGEDGKALIEAGARAFNVFEVAAGDVPGTLDKVFVASQATGVPMTKLLSLVQTYGPVLKNMGLGIEDTTALMGSLEKAGVDVSRVMPGLNKYSRDLASQGITDLKGALFDTVEQIQGATTDAEALNLATKAFGAEGAQRMSVAIRSGALDVGALAAQMGGAEGAILKTAEASETWQEKLKILRNRVLVKLEPLMVGLVDQVGNLADWISDKLLPALEEWWGKHGPGVIDTVKGILRVAEDVGNKLKRTFLPPIRAVIDALRSVASDKQMVTAALIAIGVTVTAIVVPAFIAWAAATIAATWPLIAILAAVAGLSLGIILLIEHWDEIKATVTEVIDKIVRKVESIPVIGEIFKATVRVITDKIAALKGVIQGLMAFVQELVTFVKAIFRGDWAAAWNSLKELAKIALNLLLNFLQLTFFGTIKSIFAAIVPWDWVKGAIGTFTSQFTGAFTTVRGTVIGIITGLRDDVLWVIGEIATGARTAGEAIPKALGEGISRTIGWVKGAMNAVITAIERGINRVIGLINDIPDINVSTPFGAINIGVPYIRPVSVPRLERGGYVAQTGLAVVHEGERFSRGGGAVTFNGPITVVTSDPEDFLNKLRRYAAT